MPLCRCTFFNTFTQAMRFNVNVHRSKYVVQKMIRTEKTLTNIIFNSKQYLRLLPCIEHNDYTISKSKIYDLIFYDQPSFAYIKILHQNLTSIYISFSPIAQILLCTWSFIIINFFCDELH